MLGAGTYDYIDTGRDRDRRHPRGADLQPGAVGPSARSRSSIRPTIRASSTRGAVRRSRRPSRLATGGRFTVAVNHLKSKGSACDGVGDPDAGDGQGNCNLTRTAAAQALVDWLATDPTGSGDTDFLILGDLNSYAKEDPIDAIRPAPTTWPARWTTTRT